MRKGTKNSKDLSLYDLLTVDYYDEMIKIKDTPYDKSHSLIPCRESFFEEDGLFVSPEDNSLVEIIGEKRKNIDLQELLNDFQSAESTCVAFFEGFAGCGKSTLVQYILSRQLQSYNFDHDLYNYNLEAKNDLDVRDAKGKKIKESSIFSAIINCFVEEFTKISPKYPEVINDFNGLLKYCENYQPFSNLYFRIYVTDTYKDIIRDIKNREKNTDSIKDRLLAQIQTIKAYSSCVLALDYFLRLAMYKHNLIGNLYICYDNLDAIEDAHDLIGFDDKLVDFKKLIDDFIDFVFNTGFFNDQSTPHFIILTTYRKITASIAGIANTTNSYREVAYDSYEENDQTNSVRHIDVTSVFSYKRIVLKRKEYFFKHLSSVLGIDKLKATQLKTSLQSWELLNKNLVIMEDRYAGLWNKNYRTCSLIANELFSKSEYNFTKCIQFMGKDYSLDGYEELKNDEGENILGSYFGGSAIILSNVCKVFNNKKIWNDFLDLADLNHENSSYKNVSLARLILTYIYNSKSLVTLEDLYHVFCDKNLFSYTKLCKILSKMLARNKNGFWRRPIYYANTYILAEDANTIENELLMECELLRNTNSTSKNYAFILCDSGKSYVERLASEFEFFSNRISNDNNSLYLYESLSDIKNIIGKVYLAVSNCCENALLFKEKYKKEYKIDDEKYLSSLFHPRTNRNSPQLHVERTVFSHISYLNNVRLYFIDERITSNLERRKEYNIVFVNYIEQYLDLYKEKIYPISTKRKSVYEQLWTITNGIQEEIKNSGNNLKTLFSSISLNPHNK